jgi:aryl-alcohol dehydrogenase-like predicted oxidoreductase
VVLKWTLPQPGEESHGIQTVGHHGADRQVPARPGAARGSRIAGVPDEFEEAWHKRNVERNWRTLDAVAGISEETGKSYSQISLNWLLRQEGITAPIIGARRMEQLEDNLGAASWELSEEQVARLSSASAIEEVYPYRMIREMQRV